MIETSRRYRSRIDRIEDSFSRPDNTWEQWQAWLTWNFRRRGPEPQLPELPAGAPSFREWCAAHGEDPQAFWSLSVFASVYLPRRTTGRPEPHPWWRPSANPI